MAPYNKEILPTEADLKFIRIQKNLFVIDDSLSYTELISQDDLGMDIFDNIMEDPSEVDAGRIYVNDKKMTVYGRSDMDGLPVERVLVEARNKTIDRFRIQSDGFSIGRL